MMEEVKVFEATADNAATTLNDSRYISDTIKVAVIPEKKGTFLKHTEYEITSEKHKGRVERRYNDFVQLYNQFTAKYPNRNIPRLPPKQIMLDSFLEERRVGLQRWLRLISHHPLMSEDDLFKCFLTNSLGDHQQVMQEEFLKNPDEFLNVPLEVKLAYIDVDRLDESREHIRIMLNYVVKLKRLIKEQAKREICQSRDFAEMSLVLDLVVRETNDHSVEDFSTHFSEISKESEIISTSQQNAVMERLEMIVEVLAAHSDLCDRVEKSLNAEQQAKALQANKEKLRNAIRGTSTDTTLNQPSDIEIAAQRSAFAMFCVVQESKFAQQYLKLLPSILLQFSHEEAKGFKNISEVFNKIVRTESDKLN